MGENPNMPSEGGSDEPRRDYEVGYGRPPKEHQFPKQRSGNPRGRPTGAKGLRAELKEELDEMVTITVDGKTKRVRKRRLIIKALAAKAAKGDVRAADRLLALVIQAEGFEDQRPAIKRLSEADEAILARLLDPPGDQPPTAVALEPADEISAPDEGQTDGKPQ